MTTKRFLREKKTKHSKTKALRAQWTNGLLDFLSSSIERNVHHIFLPFSTIFWLVFQMMLWYFSPCNDFLQQGAHKLSQCGLTLQTLEGLTTKMMSLLGTSRYFFLCGERCPCVHMFQVPGPGGFSPVPPQ